MLSLASAWAHFCASLIVVWAWAKANPEISIPLVGAIVTQLGKPRSPEQYATLATRYPAWFFARAAAFMQLWAAIFPDPVKARKVITKLLFGDIDQMPPPSGPSKLAAVIGVGALAVAIQACALFTPQNVQKLIDAGKVACIVQHAFVDDATMNKVCDLLTASEQAAAKDIARTHREAVGKRMASMQSDVVCADAGATDAGATDAGMDAK